MLRGSSLVLADFLPQRTELGIGRVRGDHVIVAMLSSEVVEVVPDPMPLFAPNTLLSRHAVR